MKSHQCCLLYLLSTADGVSMSKDLSEEILELIKQEPNIENKATLLIQFKMAQSLKENTDVVSKLAADMETHRREFTAHLNSGTFNKGKVDGMLKILVPVLSLAQVLILAWMSWIVSGHESNVEKIAKLQQDVGTIAGKVGVTLHE